MHIKMMNHYNDRVHIFLPIYSLDVKSRHFIYIPGYLKEFSTEDFLCIKNALKLESPQSLTAGLKDIYHTFINIATNQKEKFDSLRVKKYQPVSLTINISNDCNLNCKYCYTRHHGNKMNKHQIIDQKVVEAAAKLVAHNCRQSGKPMTIVFHGGGEPTFHWDYFTRLFMLVGKIARSFQVPQFSYVSTNGVIDTEKTIWLANHFDLTGISTDGPENIQNLNRKTTSGHNTSKTIENTIRTIRSINQNIEIRSTITPETMYFQNEIANYFINDLKIKTIRFEPEYGVTGQPFKMSDADHYIENYMQARNTIVNSGGDLQFSGVRFNEIHGVYCDVLRNNLRIEPDGHSTNCFYTGSDDEASRTGYLAESGDRFVLNGGIIQHMIAKASTSPPGCANCYLEYHCSRGCPDYCWNRKGKNELIDFRCELHRRLSLRLLCGFE